MMWALVHAVFFGMVCGIIASRRDRFVFGWVALGAIFGVFAAAALACLEIPRKSEYQQPPTSGGHKSPFKQCPCCSQQILASYIKCPHCQAELSTHTAPKKGVHMVRQGDKLVPVSEPTEKSGAEA